MSTVTIAASPYPTAVNGQCVKQSPSENCVFSSFWVSSRRLKEGHCEACAMHFKVCVPECIEERLVRQMALCYPDTEKCGRPRSSWSAASVRLSMLLSTSVWVLGLLAVIRVFITFL